MLRLSDPPAIIEFGHFSILPHRRQLLAEGRPIRLGGRAFDLLMALIEAPGAVLGKDELMSRIWPGRIVEENRLQSEIWALRKAFGADRDLIQTVSGQGYQFAGEIRVRSEVEPEKSATITAAAEPPRAAESDRASLPLPDKPSIAVLPFANMSGDPEREYFADGMVEEIITALSRIRWLFVTARNSSFAYKGQNVDVKRVGQELGVRYVLEGSVRRSRNRVRIAAQLIDAGTGAHLWADHFDGLLEDVFDLQDKVASSVAGVIEPALQAAETARSTGRPTADLTAYDLYLRAHAMVWSARQIPEALDLLEHAIARDPHYGPALAWAATCCYRLCVDGSGTDPDGDSRKGFDFAQRALEVAGDDPEVIVNAALALSYFGEDINAMIALVDRALALNPNFARGWHVGGILRLFAGQPDLAIEHAETALRLSPRARVGTSLSLIGQALFLARRFDESVPKLLLAIQEDPSFPAPYRYLAACYAHMGRLAEARAIVARLRRITSGLGRGDSWFRDAEHRDLYLSGLRLATGADSGITGVPPQVDLSRDLVPSHRPEAERRQISALSCELVGASPRAKGVSLEDLHEAVGDFHRCVSETADRHKGFVYRELGNDALVLFGYPAAHEDDAERAIHAGLELCAAVRTLRPDADVPMRCRVGIATGMVIVGDRVGVGEVRDLGIVGDAPDLAARLQVSAQPDTVTIEPATWRLIGNLFDCCDLAALDTNSDTEPIRRWHVLGQSVVASRFEALRGSKLTPLVGRDEEIDLLLRRWARAKAGDGQIILVSGEAGLGKSRITAAFEERLHAERHLRLRYFCSPYHQDSALFPIIDQLSRAAGFARDDPPASKLVKLEALLARTAPPDEDVALLADLMSLPAAERHPLPNLSPQRKKERTLEALIRQLEGLAHEKPVVTIWEDAHWLDPTSRELLDLTVERVRSLPVLLIVTFRPEFQPPWAGHPQVSMLALNRLDRRDRTVLIAQIAGKTLPGEVVFAIAERTDGVPLFVEELTKSVLERGLLREENDRYVLDRPLQPLAIPATLHASLLARLDRLGSARPVAQIGAAIGRQFSHALVGAVSGLPEDEVQAALRQLVASELVFQRGMPPDAVYSFKHALVQDAAHGSLLRNARQQLHAQIAEALEAHSPEIVESQPELLAQHYAEAGLVEQAVAFWGKAGHRSVARSAMAEAAAQFQKGLDQLALLPDIPERRQKELEFSSALGAVLNVVKGSAAPETGQAYARARELWEQLGSPVEFIQVPCGQSRYHAHRGELDQAQSIAEDLLHLSRRRNDSAGLVMGHYSSGRNLMFAGNFAASRSHLEAVLALYDPNSHHSLVRQTGVHPQLAAQAALGVVLFCLGFPDRALAQSNKAIAEARRLPHPPTLAMSLGIDALLLSIIGDDIGLEQRADGLVAFAIDQGFPFYRATGAIFRGWVKAKNADVTEGLSLLRAGSSAYCATGAAAWMPLYIALLAGACEIAGQIEEGAARLDQALQLVERTGERWFAGELDRQRGRLLLRQGHPEAAEELYCKALGIAREQEAKMWELRAAASLARLWRDQGYRAAARDLLAPVYRWFTEGFATPDLKEAKALLDGLG